VEERKEDEAAPPPDIVTLEISLITFNASLQAWYILNISSLLRASSALSSIMSCVFPVAYKFANRSPWMKAFASLIMRAMITFGTRSRQVFVTIFM